MSSASEVYLSRDELLSPPALAEKDVVFEGWGTVLCGELSGDDRAEVTEKQARAMRDGADDVIKGYQKALLSKGVLDATSPEASRTPLLRDADVGVLMHKLGGSRVRELVATIEQLSGLGFIPIAQEPAVDAAKKDSEPGLSAAGSSE